MDVFQSGSAVVPATQVEISVSCRNLRDKDAFSKSDPMCVLKSKGFKNQSYQEIGRTEMIKDSLDPEFVKKFLVQYYFEERQLMRFEIYDVDSPSAKLNHHDYLGTFEASLGELVSAPGGTTESRLRGHGSGNFGTITIRVEEVCTNKEEISLQFSAKNLDKKDFFGKSDPFLVFYRANEDNSYTVVHKTEVVKNNLNPTWRPFGVAVRTLCNGDYDRSIKIECYDWDSDGTHDLIGEFTTNLRELAKGPGAHNEYQVTLMSSRIIQIHSFLDYIKGGMQMNFTVAIDFTASNGNPSHPTSLHYINSQQLNQYSSAITSVGEIIQDYDSDKVFPVLGFGAKLPDGSISHEFAVNFNPNNPYCAGVGGILQAYYNCITKVQLYGPTNFAPVINHIARFAAQSVNGSNYYVLLIITDGVISDMNYTKEAIVKCSALPMSIIIVGVGDAEFDAMDELDSDNDRLSYRGNYAERDIVQFVPFRDFIGGRYGNDMNLSKGYLAKEILAEVPEQVVQYMKKRGIAPQKPSQNARSVVNTQPTAMGSQRGAAPPPPMGNSRGPVPPAPVGNNAQTPYPSMGQSQTANVPYPQSGDLKKKEIG
ncbi:hypothetical protein LOTGIDRAFT_228802 [Lottia gigantea]|uniref:Copine-3 n=1 Tax=Lottia gigantea TaxID=225164 RepID=V4A8K7_LOTGI|nr:hypothetical protein LOTGIDRAFT_228802 [Lottia gigantea]ESO91350.1 hypothetical protein LOTGIDRAFT_228802 [Lottia gigantea]